MSNILKITVASIAIMLGAFTLSVMFASNAAYASGIEGGGSIGDGGGEDNGGNNNSGGGGGDFNWGEYNPGAEGGGSGVGPGGGPVYAASVNCVGKQHCAAIKGGPTSIDGIPVSYYNSESGVEFIGQDCYNNAEGTLITAWAGFTYTRGKLPTPDAPDSELWLAKSFRGCGYGTWTTQEWKTCYYDGKGSGMFSRNLSEIRTSGTVLRPEGPLPGSPMSGEHSNCGSKSFYHKISVPTADYGYYRLALSNKWKSWEREGLMYNGTQYNSRWVNTGAGTQQKFGFYSFSCNADNPYNNMTVGRDLAATHGSFAAAVNAANVPNYLDPANCPQVRGKWECKVTDPTTIGLDRAALAAAGVRDASGRSATVMRNGDPVKLTYGQVKISEYANGQEKEIGANTKGSVVKDLRHVSYRDSIIGRSGTEASAGIPSTPWKAGENANSKNQMFARYVDKNGKMNSANFSTDWDRWINKNSNENRDFLMSFNWASDQGAPFATAREYQVTAKFLVPGAAGGSTTIDENGNLIFPGVSYDWKEDTRICYEKTGSGGNLVETKKPVFSKSNKVDVLRATAKND